tara:strand:- start:626 stop:877 length:252 start_codon:yes stop_codon:yes gene_type:complete
MVRDYELRGYSDGTYQVRRNDRILRPVVLDWVFTPNRGEVLLFENREAAMEAIEEDHERCEFFDEPRTVVHETTDYIRMGEPE